MLTTPITGPQERSFNPYSVHSQPPSPPPRPPPTPKLTLSPPAQDNGGTILAISSHGFAIVAGDTRQSEGYSIQTRYARKTFQLTDNVVVAVVGFQADGTALVKRIKQRLEVSALAMTLNGRRVPGAAVYKGADGWFVGCGWWGPEMTRRESAGNQYEPPPSNSASPIECDSIATEGLGAVDWTVAVVVLRAPLPRSTPTGPVPIAFANATLLQPAMTPPTCTSRLRPC